MNVSVKKYINGTEIFFLVFNILHVIVIFYGLRNDSNNVNYIVDKTR